MQRLSLTLLLLTAFLGACKVTIVKTDCLEVIATQIARDGGRVSADTVLFRTKKECKPMSGASYRAFRERNGEPGFQSDGQPPDVLVHQVHADNGGQPTHRLDISNIDNQGGSSGFADSWEVTVEYPDGDRSVFSGNF